MLDILEKAARAGGEVLLSYFQKELQQLPKTSKHDIVTQADIESQNIIVETILDSMLNKGHAKDEIGFIGEEQGMNSLAKYTFIIDPLDGTNNFSSGIDIFGVTIAVLENNEITHGIMYFPTKNEYIIAEKGRGAYQMRGDKKTKLRMVPVDLSRKILLEGTTSDPERQQKLLFIRQKLQPLVLHYRVFGCMIYEFSLLLKNAAGVEYAYGPRIWDVAASSLMLKEAGGVIIDLDGGPFTLMPHDSNYPYKLIATHPKNLSAILETINS